MIREKYGLEHGFVIEMSGTPSPKSPVDWWSQCATSQIERDCHAGVAQSIS